MRRCGYELGVGVVACGDISEVYLIKSPLFGGFRTLACADIDPEAAARQIERDGPAVRTVADLMASDDIDVILNLTIPSISAAKRLRAVRPTRPCATWPAPIM